MGPEGASRVASRVSLSPSVSPGYLRHSCFVVRTL